MQDIDDKLKKAFMFHQNNELDEAEKLYNEILAENSDNVEILYLLGFLNIQKQDFINAVRILEKAFALKIDDFEICFNLALAYKNVMNFEKSKEYYHKALLINPNSLKANFNLAALYLFEEDSHNAIKYYQSCLEIKPDDREAEYFLSLAYFRLKDYQNGFKFFEKRLCRETAVKTQEVTYPNLMSKAKLWRGEDISDKILYVYYEAGFGDMIMYARYLPLLEKRCRKLILKPQTELSELFRENFCDIEVMGYFKDEKDISFDYHIPMLSIPYVLGINNNNMFISSDKYLSANPDKCKYFKEKYMNNKKVKIGIKWQGNSYYDKTRIINIDAFYELFNLPNTQIYSAQTFDGAEEFEKISSKYDIIDLSKDFKNFSYTAAAVENLDIVICNDTSLIHLAGAMGKPAYVLLPYRYNWRWHVDLSKCDWYDSVKIFRQEISESWNDVMKRVCEDIISIYY